MSELWRITCDACGLDYRDETPCPHCGSPRIRRLKRFSPLDKVLVIEGAMTVSRTVDASD